MTMYTDLSILGVIPIVIIFGGVPIVKLIFFSDLGHFELKKLKIERDMTMGTTPKIDKSVYRFILINYFSCIKFTEILQTVAALI